VSLSSGGNLGGATAPPPPPPFTENDEFSEILIWKRAKNSLFGCKWGGGGGCRKFESFVGNLGGFAPTGKSEFPPLSLSAPCFNALRLNYIYLRGGGGGGGVQPPQLFSETQSSLQKRTQEKILKKTLTPLLENCSLHVWSFQSSSI
jgi:hypothetical protein